MTAQRERRDQRKGNTSPKFERYRYFTAESTPVVWGR